MPLRAAASRHGLALAGRASQAAVVAAVLIATGALLVLSGTDGPELAESGTAGPDAVGEGGVGAEDPVADDAGGPSDPAHPAPDVPFEHFDDGEQARLDDWEGEPMVVNFWASWCPPCVAEMRDAFEPVHQDLGDQVTFLGVNLQDSRDAARDVVEETGVTYDLARDPNGELFTAFGGFGRTNATATPNRALDTAKGSGSPQTPSARTAPTSRPHALATWTFFFRPPNKTKTTSTGSNATQNDSVRLSATGV